MTFACPQNHESVHCYCFSRRSGPHSASNVQAIGQKISAYKKKVTVENIEADVSHFVIMEGVFKRLEELAESLKKTLGSPFVVQQHSLQGSRPVMPKGDLPLPFTMPRPAALKPGAVLCLVDAAV
jgi:hypothetical protein